MTSLMSPSSVFPGYILRCLKYLCFIYFTLIGRILANEYQFCAAIQITGVKERPQLESNLHALQGEVSLGKGFPLGVNTSENGAWHLLG